MKTIWSFFWIYILAIGAAGQANTGRIEGTVTDPSAAAVANTTLILTASTDASKNTETTTNGSGVYNFENIAPGRYVLRISDGRWSESGTPFELKAGERLILDIKISSLRPIRETVSVSADASQPLDEVSKTIDIIGGQEMRDRADFALPETLRSIPGFRVQQLGGFGRTASIKTRGLRNQDTAVLLDGIRFRDVASIYGDASPFLSDFTLTSVSKIEVLRGSGSSLYGTNAIGGTVNFITPDPKPGLHGQFSGAWGGLGLQRYRGNISDGTLDGKFAFNLAIARTVYAEGIDGDDDAHNTNVQSRLKWQPTERTSISGRFFISDAYTRLNTSPDTLGTPPASNFGIIDAEPDVNFKLDLDDPDSFQSSKFFNGQFVFSHMFSPAVLFEAYYSGLRSSRKSGNGLLGPGFQSESTSFFDGTVQTVNANVNWSPGEMNSVKSGYEFEHEKFGNDGTTPDGLGNFFTRAYQSSHTVYAQDLISLMDRKLQFAIGARGQWFSLGEPKFSLENSMFSGAAVKTPAAAYTFDGAVSYFFESTGTKLRAHIGNGYRVPSLYERFGSFYSSFGKPEFIALGDPSLKPERTIAFDGGIEQNLFGERAKLTAVYFYTKLIDTIGYGNVVPMVGNTERPFGGYLNQKGGIARGAEFSAALRPAASTYIFASYTYTNSDQNEPQVSGSGVYRSLGIPADQFSLVATQNIGRFWVNFDFLASSSYLAPIFSNQSFNTYAYRFPGNRRADLTAGYTFPLRNDELKLRLFGTVENVFGYEYFENGFQTVGRNARVGLSLAF